MKKIILTVFLSMALPVNAEVTIPNVFKENTPAKAEEVNKNFNYLADEIQKNIDQLNNVQTSTNLSEMMVGSWDVYWYASDEGTINSTQNITFYSDGTFCSNSPNDCSNLGTWSIDERTQALKTKKGGTTTNQYTNGPVEYEPRYEVLIRIRKNVLYFQRASTTYVYVKTK